MSQTGKVDNAAPSCWPSWWSATSRSNGLAASAPSRATVVAQNRSLAAARAAPTIRSTRPGGSIWSALQRASSDSRSRSSDTSTGATSSAAKS